MFRLIAVSILSTTILLATPAIACNDTDRAQHRAYIKSIQNEIAQDRLSVMKKKAELRRAIRRASK